MHKKIIHYVLVLMMVVGLLPYSELQADAAETTGASTGWVSYINPLYEDVLEESDLVQPSAQMQARAFTVAATEYYSSVEEAGAYLRDQMEQREESISLTIKTTRNDFLELITDIYEEGFAHTGEPTEGDYLRWQWGGYSLSYTYRRAQNGYYVTIYSTMTYYTTAEQEKETDAAVATLLSELDLTGSDYRKFMTIYDWICANVEYDYDTLMDDSYLGKYTAYAALVKRTSVCQGYSNLLYRLLLEVGIDARLVAGDAGEAHSWNIVKLGDWYYNTDSTWDASCYQWGYPYNWCLKGSENFEQDHARWTDLFDAEFEEAHPTSTTDFVLCQGTDHDWDAGVVITEASCTQVGEILYTCQDCSKEKTETVTATDHSWNAFYTVDEEATCTTAGVENVYCSICHVMQEEGSRALEMTGHTVVTDAAVAATHSHTGLTEGSHCSVCNEVLVAQNTIEKINTVTLSAANYIYNGKVQRPTVTVKDSNGKVINAQHYTVSYASGCKKVGQYTATITFKGDYEGTVTKTFQIRPKATSFKKVTSAKKAIVLKWNKRTAQVTGYQIQYATNKAFTKGKKSIWVKKATTVTKTIKQLSAKKTYYVRIRTYKTVSGTKFYSDWSTVQKIKTK